MVGWCDVRRGQVDIAVPVIDGTPLHEILGGRFEGIETGLVAPPSQHLLGSPSYVEHGQVVLLDGGCWVAGCCGVMADVVVSDDAVRWTNFFAMGEPAIPADLSFEFDRSEYVAALASIESVAIEPFDDGDDAE